MSEGEDELAEDAEVAIVAIFLLSRQFQKRQRLTSQFKVSSNLAFHVELIRPQKFKIYFWIEFKEKKVNCFLALFVK